MDGACKDWDLVGNCALDDDSMKMMGLECTGMSACNEEHGAGCKSHWPVQGRCGCDDSTEMMGIEGQEGQCGALECGAG